MNNDFSMTRRVVVAAAFFTGASTVARADGNGTNRFGGDGDAYFNENKPIVVDRAPNIDFNPDQER